jgi:hypothetical protein
MKRSTSAAKSMKCSTPCILKRDRSRNRFRFGAGIRELGMFIPGPRKRWLSEVRKPGIAVEPSALLTRGDH